MEVNLEVIYMRWVNRRLRHIVSATGQTHTYDVDYYTEYDDGGEIEFVISKTVPMSKVNINLTDPGSNWQEYRSSCPGWFRCDPPKGHDK